MTRSFYPFTENTGSPERIQVHSAARIAIYDDLSASPRVLIVDAQPIREYLEEITEVVFSEAQKQGGSLPFMVIRECVENFIHAYFLEPVVSIYNSGNTISFSDSGPGIKDKENALLFGTTSATPQMKRYIRGTGSGLPYIQHYLLDKGGSLTITDNIKEGTVVILSLVADTAKPEPPSISLTPREKQVLSLVQKTQKVGPNMLVDAYKGSLSTWSRCLQGLVKAGLLQKGTQQFSLTKAGKTLISQTFPSK